eukprot:g56787.t1
MQDYSRTQLFYKGCSLSQAVGARPNKASVHIGRRNCRWNGIGDPSCQMMEEEEKRGQGKNGWKGPREERAPVSGYIQVIKPLLLSYVGNVDHAKLTILRKFRERALLWNLEQKRTAKVKHESLNEQAMQSNQVVVVPETPERKRARKHQASYQPQKKKKNKKKHLQETRRQASFLLKALKIRLSH